MILLLPLGAAGFEWPGRLERVVASFPRLDERAQAEALVRLRDFSASDLSPHASTLVGNAKPAALPPLVRLLGDLRVPCALAMEPLLVHPEAEVRRSAARAFGAMDPGSAPARLLRVLEDPKPEVRAAAAFGLGRIGATDEVAIPLIRALEDAHRSVVKAALASLVLRRAQLAAPALVDRALDRSSPIRLESFRALGSLGSEVAVDPLISGLSDRDPAVRLAAAEGLWNLRSGRAATALMARRSDTPAVARVAEEALGIAAADGPSDFRWVEVRTVDGRGVPRGGVDVVVTPSEGPPLRGRTNADGVLRLTSVPAGSVTVHAGALPSPPR